MTQPSTIFTTEEVDVLLSALGFAQDDLDLSGVNDICAKIWDGEPFTQEEIRTLREAMSYSEEYMYHHCNVQPSTRLDEHHTSIETKISSMS